MVDQARARRLSKRISQIVAAALEHEVKDPRLTMVTITDTRVTGDLREATVYYTVLGETVDADPDLAGAAAALASATGVLRSMVGAQTGIRHTPSLAFVADIVPDES
ncbi:MAG: 30S ribosome-binding factor RbfA, partial [Pseudonocardia sp.]|nr:30S ribosome-binding factor RbfA [Pseudonocardia sp.]